MNRYKLCAILGISISLTGCFDSEPYSIIPYKELPKNIITDTISREILQLTLRAEDLVFWNESLIDTNSFRDCLIVFTDRSIKSGKRKKEYDNIGLQNQNNVQIYLHSDLNTTYRQYLRIQDKIDQARDSLREIYSHIHFEKPYMKLLASEQETIRSITSIGTIEN
jgi:hypothetical protein